MAGQLNSKQLASLQDLVHIDLDAVTLYDAALRRRLVPLVEQALMEFRSEHLRHIRELNDLLAQSGGERVRIDTASAEPCTRHGFMPIHEDAPLQELITALVEGETVINQVHERVLKEDWTPELRECIGSDFDDEQRHLLWLLHASHLGQWEQGMESRPGL